jgi:hypothetical protein
VDGARVVADHIQPQPVQIQLIESIVHRQLHGFAAVTLAAIIRIANPIEIRPGLIVPLDIVDGDESEQRSSASVRI